MGYAGGAKENPTYHSLGDHTETLQLDFDPEQVTYSSLLQTFWHNHAPNSRPFSKQYMAIIFTHSPEQELWALESLETIREQLAGKIYTEIQPYRKFYLAEDYHQKYYLQRVPEVLQDLAKAYPSFKDLVDSTAAAKINGHIAGYGTLEQLEAEIDKYGLTESSQKRLLELVAYLMRGK